jgi:hypothetical protein
MGKTIDFSEFLSISASVSSDEMMGRVLTHSRKLTGSEAGTIFLVRREGGKKWLEATHFQNDRIPVPRAGLRVPLNTASIAGYAAETGKMLRIPDAYRISVKMPFRFNPASDIALGYTTRSILAFPMKNGDGVVVGVVQLINRLDERGGDPVPFRASHAALLAPLNHFVGTAIERADMLDRISRQNVELNRQSRRIAGLQRETERAFQVSVGLLARAAELHDEDTGNHILRVNEYSYMIAKLLRQPAEWCREIRYSAALHDVGKMSVDAAVLKKRGGLDPAEREEINRHSEYGWLILKDNPRLAMAADIAYCHHEKWDGTGYPRRLAGEAIPLSARIVQLADIYDALRSARPYKPAFTHEHAVRILTVGDDRIRPERDFDPALTAVFARHHLEFEKIWARLVD